MTRETAQKLADLLEDDETFVFVADCYQDALDNDGGLHDVIAALREVES